MMPGYVRMKEAVLLFRAFLIQTVNIEMRTDSRDGNSAST